MDFAAAASMNHSADIQRNNWPLLTGLIIAAALIAMAASSYVGGLGFSPSSLTVNQTQVHSSPASMAQSKSGSSVTTFSTNGIVPESEGAINAQAAANAFDSIAR